MLETYSYTSPARVKTLVVPSEEVTAELFENYYNLSLSKYFEVRLVDVTPSSGMFNPQGYPHGRIVYDYQLTPPDSESIFLQDFEPFRKVFNVICLAKYDPAIDFQDKLENLRKDHSNSLNHSIIVFETPDIISSDKLVKDKNIFYLDNSKKFTALETILCDITSCFLETLSIYASSYQHVTLRSPGSVASGEVTLSVQQQLDINKKSRPLSNGHSFLSGRSVSSSSPMSPTSGSTSVMEKKKKRISSLSFLPNFDHNSGALNQERLKLNRNKGRQRKIFGNLHLLSGRLNDALKEFCDSIVLLKQCNDYLWLGSALDGLGVCLLMLTFLEVPYQLPNSITGLVNSGPPTSDLPALLSPVTSPRNSTSSSITRTLSNQHFSPQSNGTQLPLQDNLPPEVTLANSYDLITRLITKAISYYKLTFDNIEDCVPQIVYCESVLRYIKLQSLIHINKGLDFKLLKHIVQNVPLSRDSIEKKNPYPIDKTQIVLIEQDIFNPQFVKLDFLHKIRIYACLISISTDLGLLRRRAFLLNQLFDIITPHLTAKKVEVNTNLSSISTNKKFASSYERNSTSVLDLVETIMQEYGIDLDPNETDCRAFLPNWIDLHLMVLDKFVSLMEKLGFLGASIKYSCIMLKGYAYVLSSSEQLKIFNRIRDQVKQLRIVDPDFSLLYWDDYLARDIQSVPAISDLTPIKQNKLDNKSTLKPGVVYTPFSSNDIQGELVTLVQGETADIVVTLQNSFAFDIDVKQLRLVTEDGFEIKTIQSFPSAMRQQQQQEASQLDLITVKPHQLSQVIVTFIPLQSGSLKITGIKAQICDCEERVFDICESKNFKVHEKIKYIGTHRHGSGGLKSSVMYQNDHHHVVKKSLQYHVLTPQPVLSLVGTSLLNKSIMLLEGESKNFSMTLLNNSLITINHLTSLFFDSTAEPLKKALTSKLPPNEIYEIEYYLFKKLPFNIVNKREIERIEGHQEFTIQVMLLGKRGMTYGSIMLEYGNVMESHQLEYIRRIDIPLNITVYPSIEIASCDIIPLFNSDLIFDNNPQLLKLEKRVKFWSYLYDRITAKGEKLTDYCLLSLDLRNAWNGGDLKVELSSSKEQLVDEDLLVVPEFDALEKSVIVDTIGKGRTERFLIPINRIRLAESLCETSIPSLRNKQYVVDNVTPKEEQKFVKELFWYRQELLKHIRGAWSFVGCDKSQEAQQQFGEIELRGIRLSSKMLNILKVGDVEIEQSIVDKDGSKIMRSDSLNYDLSLHDFYTIKTVLYNNSNHPLTGILRHIPISKSTSVSVDRKLLFNGVLQSCLPNTLQPGESVESDLSICVLESGEFEWGVVFDELGVDGEGNVEEKESHVMRGSMFIVAI